MKAFRLALAALGLALAAQAGAQSAAPAATETAKEAATAPAPAPAMASGDAMSGTAAWYGRKFAGRKTASGKRFNPNAMTAAHPSLAFGTRIKVTNTKNKRSAVVTITDRGPTTPGRVIDVSQAAAKKLGFIRAGLTDVTLEVVGKK